MIVVAIVVIDSFGNKKIVRTSRPARNNKHPIIDTIQQQVEHGGQNPQILRRRFLLSVSFFSIGFVCDSLIKTLSLLSNDG